VHCHQGLAGPVKDQRKEEIRRNARGLSTPERAPLGLAGPVYAPISCSATALKRDGLNSFQAEPGFDGLGRPDGALWHRQGRSVVRSGRQGSRRALQFPAPQRAPGRRHQGLARCLHQPRPPPGAQPRCRRADASDGAGGKRSCPTRASPVEADGLVLCPLGGGRRGWERWADGLRVRGGARGHQSPSSHFHHQNPGPYHRPSPSGPWAGSGLASWGPLETASRRGRRPQKPGATARGSGSLGRRAATPNT